MKHNRTIYLKIPIKVYYEKGSPYVIIPDHNFQEKYGISFPIIQGKRNHTPRTLKEILNFAASINRYKIAEAHKNWQLVYNLAPFRFHTNKIYGIINQPLTSISMSVFGFCIWLRKALSVERRSHMIGGKFIPFTNWNISLINQWKHVFKKLPEINSKPYKVEEK